MFLSTPLNIAFKALEFPSAKVSSAVDDYRDYNSIKLSPYLYQDDSSEGTQITMNN
jgi:hypothetical protein